MRYVLTLALVLVPSLARAAEAPATDALLVEVGKNTTVSLAGKGAWRQLLVTARSGSRLTDVTRSAAYSAAPADIVKVDENGFVTPLKEGKATITITFAGKSVRVEVVVSHIESDLAINFANEIVPIFTKFGCNAGGCHGKASGQNGFKLSLLGFEPEEDYEYLVLEARGRRLLPSAPALSLLVVKATGQVAHGGGKRLEPNSPFYEILVRWVAQGAPRGRKNDPTVQSIEVLPAERILERGASQQLAVLAHMSDGSVRDVTRMTQFEANVPEMADVSETGLTTVKQLPGRVAIMARFQSHVAVSSLTVPLGAQVTNLPESRTFVDRLVFKQLEALGLPPSKLAGDNTFIRRVTLDLCGRLPTTKEVEQYAADKSADKAEKLIDNLLASSDHADYFTNKWNNLLRNRRASPQDSNKPNLAFHGWIRDSILKNKPYDTFVREVLTASGEEVKTPPVVWYRELKGASEMVEDSAQLFLGQRLACAKCHHHPLEKWSQEDYWGMTAFFSQVNVKIPPPPKKANKKDKDKNKEEEVRVATVTLKSGKAQAVNPRTNKPVLPTGLGGKPMNIAKDEDPRLKLADWMTARDNPYFARTLANRYWKHFMGRGLVDPEDDMRVTNPATNQELLDALAKSFVESQYDKRKLIRTICNSTVYRLSAVPNEHNAGDRQNYSRFLPRRLHAEVLLDAIDDVTLMRTQFKGAPAKTRAVQLPDNLFDSYFLSVFGRPDAASACECERSSESSLAQALHMINSKEVLDKVAGQRARDLVKDKRPHAEKLRDLYMVALSRPPSEAEMTELLGHIQKKGPAVQTAYEDILWVVINTKEFLFNH